MKCLLRISPPVVWMTVLVCGTNSVCATHVWTNTTRTKAQLPSGHLSDLSSSTVLHFVSLNKTRATEITYFLYHFFHLISVCLNACIPYCYQYLLLSPTFDIDWLPFINCPPDLLKKKTSYLYMEFHLLYSYHLCTNSCSWVKQRFRIYCYVVKS